MECERRKYEKALIFAVIFATLALVSVGCASAAEWHVYPEQSIQTAINNAGVSLDMHVSALQKEFPDEVMKVKEGKNIVYVSTWFEGKVKVYDSDSKWRTKDVLTEYSITTGFHGSRSGHMFIPAHGVEYSEEEVKEMLLMEYVMSSKWFDEKLFENNTYFGYYWSVDAEQYFNELKEKLDNKTLDIVDIEPVYSVFSPYTGKSHELRERDIKFKGNSTTAEDIVIIKIDVPDTPSVIFNKDFKYEEGTKLYIIHYAEYTLYEYVDDIVAERLGRPSTYKEVLISARNKMFEDIKDRGADIESGYLGSTTHLWGATTTYRFTGYTPGGCSGAPVLDGEGHCVGMIAWGWELSEGVVDPTNAYFIPYKYLKAVSKEAGFESPEYVSIIEKIWVNKLEIFLGVLTVIGSVVLVIEKRRGFRRIRYAIEKIRGFRLRRSKK